MIADSLILKGKAPGQILVGRGDGYRLTLVASDASTAEAALPSRARLLICRALGPIMIRFGVTGMDPAAVDDDSILFPPGEAPIVVPKTGAVLATHVRIIRADEETGDYNVQFEEVETVG